MSQGRSPTWVPGIQLLESSLLQSEKLNPGTPIRDVDVPGRHAKWPPLKLVQIPFQETTVTHMKGRLTER